MTSRGFFSKKESHEIKKKSSRQLRKISYVYTVIPTEIPTNEYQAILTDEYRQYQPRGGGYDTDTGKVVGINLVCNSRKFALNFFSYGAITIVILLSIIVLFFI
jgi:hypothetical protein